MLSFKLERGLMRGVFPLRSDHVLLLSGATFSEDASNINEVCLHWLQREG